MNDEDFESDIAILMTDQNVQFKVKTLIIYHARNYVNILDWLLLKSPNLINLRIDLCYGDSY
jgi:hypothetical protein